MSKKQAYFFVLLSLIILFAPATLSGFCMAHYLFRASRSQSGQAGSVFSFFITSHSARVTSLIFPPPCTQWLCVLCVFCSRSLFWNPLIGLEQLRGAKRAAAACPWAICQDFWLALHFSRQNFAPCDARCCWWRQPAWTIHPPTSSSSSFGLIRVEG